MSPGAVPLQEKLMRMAVLTFVYTVHPLVLVAAIVHVKIDIVPTCDYCSNRDNHHKNGRVE